MLHRYMDTPSGTGLVDLLNSKMPLDGSLSGFGGIPCWILPVGDVGDQANELLKTQRLASILTDLREQFEYILINAPPILPLADMNVLAGVADVMVMVVRAGSTPQQVVRGALNTLGVRADEARIILNAVDSHALPYSMYYDYHDRQAETQRV